MAERSDAELDGFASNEQGTMAALVWNVAGRSEIGFVDLASAPTTNGPALPAEIAGGPAVLPRRPAARHDGVGGCSSVRRVGDGCRREIDAADHTRPARRRRSRHDDPPRTREVHRTTDSSFQAGSTHRIADPGGIGITGGSYGGHMTLVGLTEYPDLFAAGVDLYGTVNFFTFFEHTEPWMTAISTIEYGDPKTQPDLLRALSRLGKLDRIRTPLMVQHGANDTNVPVVEAEQAVENLKKRGVTVEYILFSDEAHGWRKIRIAYAPPSR
jgi:dienelactone hydrolase